MKKLLDFDWSSSVQLLCNSVQKRVSAITISNHIHKKLLDSDWSKAVQLLCNSEQKSVIPCRNL